MGYVYSKISDVKYGLKLTLAVIAYSLLLVLLISGCQTVCNASQISTTNLQPSLVSKFETLKAKAKAEGIEFKIISGYRSPKEQLELYAQGRTKPGKIVTKLKDSKHCHGKAVDVAILKNGKISWDPKDYARIGQIGVELGLIWGGNWKMRDYGHFEI